MRRNVDGFIMDRYEMRDPDMYDNDTIFTLHDEYERCKPSQRFALEFEDGKVARMILEG